MSSNLANYKKSTLIFTLSSLDIHTTSKDTKKSLVEKLEKYIHSNNNHHYVVELLDSVDDDGEKRIAKDKPKAELAKPESRDSKPKSESKSKSDFKAVSAFSAVNSPKVKSGVSKVAEGASSVSNVAEGASSAGGLIKNAKDAVGAAFKSVTGKGASSVKEAAEEAAETLFNESSISETVSSTVSSGVAAVSSAAASAVSAFSNHQDSENGPISAFAALNDDDDDDEEYRGPPIDLKEKLVDPLITHYESLHSSVLNFTDKIGVTTTNYSESLREKLSKTLTLTYLEILLELYVFYKHFVTFTPFSNNKLIHYKFFEYFHFIPSYFLSFPTIDFFPIYHSNTLSIFIIWLLSSIILPLTLSYFINFSKRVLVFDGEEGIIARIYRFDPFIFNLSKVVIFFFLKNNSEQTKLKVFEGYLNAFKNFAAIQIGFYHNFATILGNLPLIIGLANVSIALYSQFEDF